MSIRNSPGFTDCKCKGLNDICDYCHGKKMEQQRIIKLINDNKIKGCQVWGKLGTDSFVIENACSEGCDCEVCKEDEIYILDIDKILKLVSKK